MRRLLLLIALTALPLAGVGPLAAQPVAAEPLAVTPVDVSEAPAATAVVTTPPALSDVDLDEALTVTVGGRPVDVEVTRLPADDLDIVLLVDTSGSMRDAMAIARRAATSFVQSLPPGVRVAVVRFGTEVATVSPFTADVPATLAAIEGLRPAGETALYDAIDTSLSLFDAAAPARRAIVLLSDGGDTASTGTMAAVQERLAVAATDLYAVELVTEESDPAVLRALAGVTGGRVAAADEPDDLAGVYAQIRSLLVNQYEVAFEVAGHGEIPVTFALRADGGAATAEQLLSLPAPPEGPAAAPEPTPAPPPVSGAVQPRPEGLAARASSGLALAVGALAWFAALTIAFLGLVRPRRRTSQLDGAARRAVAGRTGLAGLAAHATSLAESSLRRRGRDRGLNAALERAGIDLRPGEVIVVVLCASVAAAVLGALLAGPSLALVLPILVVVASRLLISGRGQRRQAAFAEQLAETLQILASSLRAGYSFLQAVDAVAREAEAPASEEFHRLVVETRLGRDLGDALHAMEQRLGNEDFGWVLQAIEINREVGGDLAEVLDTVAGTIRDREQIRRQVKTLSAEGRVSAVILMILPFAVGLFMLVANPGYLAEFTTNGVAGYAMLGAGAALLLAGGLWLKSIVKIEF